MSTNPFSDYQEQFFKMWNDNMNQMMNSDAYKEMAKNIPGAEAYQKAMENMIPNVENYWKNVASAFPGMPQTMPFMDYWKNMMPQQANPFMDYFKNIMNGSNPVMDYWKNIMEGPNPFMDYYKKMMDGSNPVMDYWKDMADKMPDFNEYWKSFSNMMPQNYWDSVSKMMPDPAAFANMFPYKVPGFDSFAKVFDLWKSFGDPNALVEDFQKKYMDVNAEVMKNLFPANVQPFVVKPMDFMNMMVEYYKQFVSPWMQIDPEIMENLSKGDLNAYVDFFKDYAKKYEENLEKYFTFLNMGVNREASDDYMRFLNEGNKAMISMGELFAVITKTSAESFNEIGERVQAELADGKSITTFRDFYNIWYSVTEAAFEKLLLTDEFANVFDDFSNKYSQFMIAQNKMAERMLSSLPIPTNTDMKSLYKTVYDLRKDVRDIKRAMAAAEEKGDKQ
jgi:class III poly(R)-hydroxyalkanoic acid synthase PhaE subunit